MIFDLRHAETPEPMELFRMGGENAMLWTAEPWTDTPSDQADESLDRILAVLSRDRMARYKAKAIEDMAGIKRTALYGKLNRLVRNGQIKKDGNLYYVPEEEQLGGILEFPSGFRVHFFRRNRTDAESSINGEGY